MKVKMRTLSAGPDGIRRIGSIVDVSDYEGLQLVNGGYAEELPTVTEPIAIQTSEAEIEPIETREEAEPETTEDKKAIKRRKVK